MQRLKQFSTLCSLQHNQIPFQIHIASFLFLYMVLKWNIQIIITEYQQLKYHTQLNTHNQHSKTIKIH